MIKRVPGLILILLLLAHLIALGLGAGFVYREVFGARTIPAEFRDYQVREGAALNDVIADLHERDLAPNPFPVRLAIALKGEPILIKKGRYLLPERASTWEILTLFDSGKVELTKVTLPEGLDKWQVAELLGKQQWGTQAEFAAVIEDPSTITAIDPEAQDLEGYLFPETYFFPQEATPEEIVHTMVRQFIEQTESLRHQLAGRDLTIREWVALASMVEKETSLDEERALIAGVFQNRLDKRMLLQCDPTIIYSLKRENLYKGKIYRSQIRYDSAYNTYVYPGLPPGPIASPGLASLEAALAPQETEYIFFVAKKDGSHHFSRTLREHNRAVNRYQR